MMRRLIISLSLFFAVTSFAKSAYQIDMIVFAHPKNINQLTDIDTPLIPVGHQFINLQSSATKTKKLYTLLPPSQSSLRDEFYLLNRKSQFKVLAQYSWLQNTTHQKKVTLPKMNHKGWLMQGTLEVKKAGFYTFDANVQFSPPNKPDAAITIAQKQRLESGKLYYLDNPYIGMVVKIYNVS